MVAAIELRRLNETSDALPVAETSVTHRVVIASGGHLDMQERMDVLKAVQASAGGGKLAVATFASKEKEEGNWNEHLAAFGTLEFDPHRLIHVDSTDATPTIEDVLEDGDVTAMFATGGMQDLFMARAGENGRKKIREKNRKGVVVGGTSAGAAILGEFMIVGHQEGIYDHATHTYDIKPGLGLVPNAFVDQHFTQRERHPRLAEAVSVVAGAYPDQEAPWGFGVDEDTAAIFVDDEYCDVIGTGAVTVFDGTRRQEWPEAFVPGDVYDGSNGVFTLFEGDRFNMAERQAEVGTNGNIIYELQRPESMPVAA